jgi:protein-tyrosine-phosphatase
MDQNPNWKDALRRIVPPVVLYERGVILKLGNAAGRLYAQMRVLDWLGFRGVNAATAPSSARNIVFVCFGNIMRSPVAEALFHATAASTGLTGLQISSAGLHAIPGNTTHPWALTAAEELGVTLVDHRAKLITSEIVKNADAIFTMDFQNKAEMITRFPTAKNKIVMLSSYAEGTYRCREIRDPYFGDLDATRQCFKVIRNCVLNLTSALSANERKQSQAV